MPRKKTETAPVAEAKMEKPSTANKTARQRETKEKTNPAKNTPAANKPRAKKETAPKEPEVEVVEAELVDDGNKKKHKRGGNNNLIPNSERTPEELREMTQKGGIASGKARRRKKELREFTRDFLMQEAVPALKGNMGTLGVEAEEMSNLAAMVVRMFSKAVNQGDLNAARTLIEWAGMAPLQEMQENTAIAKMAQVMQLAGSNGNEEIDDGSDVVFYIPNNGRTVILDEEPVNM